MKHDLRPTDYNMPGDRRLTAASPEEKMPGMGKKQIEIMCGPGLTNTGVGGGCFLVGVGSRRGLYVLTHAHLIERSVMRGSRNIPCPCFGTRGAIHLPRFVLLSGRVISTDAGDSESGGGR